MITIKEIVERFQNAERLYEEIHDLSKRQTEHVKVIDQNRIYSESLVESRDGVIKSGGVNITWYKKLNRGIGIAYDEFDKLIDENISSKYEDLKEIVLGDIYKVKAICQELSYIEPWLIHFDFKNYMQMDAYLKEYNNCPFCGYLSYDQSKCADENFREYLNRIQEDLDRAIKALPILYHHLDNTKIALKQKGIT